MYATGACCLCMRCTYVVYVGYVRYAMYVCMLCGVVSYICAQVMCVFYFMYCNLMLCRCVCRYVMCVMMVMHVRVCTHAMCCYERYVCMLRTLLLHIFYECI